MKKTVGGSEFELIPYAEASLVNKFTIYTARPLRIHRRCQNPFIFRKSFLGGERPGQVQFAQRPGGFTAKRPQILHDLIDLIQGQSVRERGHDLRPTPGGSALVNRGLPIEGVFASAAVAVGKVRELWRLLESQCALWLSLASWTVTSDAGRFIYLFTRIKLEFGRRVLRDQNALQASGNDDKNDRTH